MIEPTTWRSLARRNEPWAVYSHGRLFRRPARSKGPTVHSASVRGHYYLVKVQHVGTGFVSDDQFLRVFGPIYSLRSKTDSQALFALLDNLLRTFDTLYGYWLDCSRPWPTIINSSGIWGAKQASEGPLLLFVYLYSSNGNSIVG
jgi:hypothetical protein